MNDQHLLEAEGRVQRQRWASRFDPKTCLNDALRHQKRDLEPNHEPQEMDWDLSQIPMRFIAPAV